MPGPGQGFSYGRMQTITITWWLVKNKDSDFVDLSWGQKNCIFNKHLGDFDATGP